MWRSAVAEALFSFSCAQAAEKYTRGVGTPLYMAPELVQNSTYSASADMYSFAVSAWQIFAEKLPFQDISSTFSLIKYISDGNRPAKVLFHPIFSPLLHLNLCLCWPCRHGFLVMG